MDQLKEHLLSVGMTQEEITIYTAILEAGSESILHISQRTGIPRTTVYLLVEELLAKQIIAEIVEGKKKRYIPTSPQEIVKYAQNKKRQLVESIDKIQSELPQLQALYNLTHGKPKVLYYAGIAGIKKVLEQTLKSENVYYYCMSNGGREAIGEIFEDYYDKAVNTMIHTKRVMNETPQHIQFKKKHETARNQIVCLPNQYATEADTIVFSTNVVYITYIEYVPQCILIDDPHISHFEKVRFNLLWELVSSTK